MGVKKIKLTQGKFALVDARNFKWLSQWKWYFHRSARDITGYAWRNERVHEYKGRTRRRIGMHNAIMQLKFIDHKNGVGTDNRRANLRKSSPQNQSYNKAVSRANKSCGLKGVSQVRNRKNIPAYWIARITVNKARLYLGVFKTKELAAKAYNKAAKKYHKEFAWNSCRN